jgi:flagellar capping protein FliD
MKKKEKEQVKELVHTFNLYSKELLEVFDEIATEIKQISNKQDSVLRGVKSLRILCKNKKGK